MASARRQKEALRAAVFAFFAGAHYITDEVEKALSMTSAGSTKDATEMRHAMLEADYERLRESLQLIDMFADTLAEEDLYPFGPDWPRDALAMLAEKVIPPKLLIEDADRELRFRFKKGFRSLLIDLGNGLEPNATRPSSLDHWMVLLINSAFLGGATVAARSAENPKLYYDIMTELEGETEPWSRYTQLAELLDRQLRRETRRKTGLVTSDTEVDY